MGGMIMDKINVKCSKCNYEWATKSNHIFVSCPSCLNKVKVKEEINEEAEK